MNYYSHTATIGSTFEAEFDAFWSSLTADQQQAYIDTSLQYAADDAEAF